jgi:hypothetical protein
MDTNKAAETKIDIDALTPDQRRLLLANVSSMTLLGLDRYTWARESALSREIKSTRRARQIQRNSDDWHALVASS